VGFDAGAASASIFAALNAEFTDAVVAATAMAISLDKPERVLAPLQVAATMAPLHETVQAGLISALGASGQRAEALTVFHTVRNQLAEELGIDPGPALTEAHLRVLNAPTDRRGQRPASEQKATQPDDRAVAAEPYRVLDFRGRLGELETIHSFVATDVRSRRAASALLITGPPGVGKTTTTLEALHGAVVRGSRLFVNLHGFDVSPLTPLQVLRALLTQLNKGEVPPNSLDEAAAAWRSAVGGGPFVVVLDNASLESQVRPVLAVDGPITVIVTSRRTLPGLESIGRITLGPLPRDESEQLLAALLPESQRLDANLSGLADMCGDLPLALRIAGARIASRPHWSVADFIGRLGDERNRLQQLVAGDLAVETTFSLSYNALDPTARELFRSLALLHGTTFSAKMAAAIHDLDDYVCRDQLDALVDLGLLELVHGDRYRLHDLLRLYAADRLRAETPVYEARAQQLRLDRWTLDTTGAAARTFPYGWAVVPEVTSASEEEMQSAKEWLATESSHWFGSLKSAADLGEHRLVVDTAMALTGIAGSWGDWPDWAGVHAIGAESASRTEDRESYVVQLVAAAATIPDENPAPGEAVSASRRALAAAESWGELRWVAWARHLLAWALFEDGDVEGARREARIAQDEFVEVGDLNGELLTRSWVLRTLTLLDAKEAIVEAEALIAAIDSLGADPERVLYAATLLDIFTAVSRLLRSLDRFDESLALTTRMLQLTEPFLGGGGFSFIALRHRGFALLGLQQFAEARVVLETALSWTNPYLPDQWGSEIREALETIATHGS
jgi:tetratricopeptide (TPR) repeat protein